MRRELTDEEEMLLEEYSDIAYDERNGKVLRKRCFRKAIELDPNDWDLHLGLIMLDFEGSKNADVILQKIEEIEKKAEDELTEEGYWEDKGDFWYVFETRPYMRILLTKFHIYKAIKQTKESIDLATKILELNTNDNQGVRYSLMGLYAYTGDLDNAMKLYKKYPEDSSSFLFPLAYLYFVLGQEGKANQYLEKLHKENPYLLEFFCNGLSHFLDYDAPDFYSPGKESEVLVVMGENLYAYVNKPFDVFVENFLDKE